MAQMQKLVLPGAPKLDVFVADSIQRVYEKLVNAEEEKALMKPMPKTPRNSDRSSTPRQSPGQPAHSNYALSRLAALIPVVKVDNEGNYLIGTDVKTVVERKTDVAIRLGGGFVPLDEFIEHDAIFQSMHLMKRMKQDNASLAQVTLSLYDEWVKKYGEPSSKVDVAEVVREGTKAEITS